MRFCLYSDMFVEGPGFVLLYHGHRVTLSDSVVL